MKDMKKQKSNVFSASAGKVKDHKVIAVIDGKQIQVTPHNRARCTNKAWCLSTLASISEDLLPTTSDMRRTVSKATV